MNFLIANKRLSYAIYFKFKMLIYGRYHKPLEKCIICGNDFIKATDKKTCSDKCQIIYDKQVNHEKYTKYHKNV